VNSAPILDSSCRILAAVTVFLDITDRHRAEEERTELLRRIVTTQEDERRRIARELHDQMGQHITALMLWIKALGDGPGEATADRDRQFHRLREMIDEIGREAHRIALELRPTALDDLGLHSALLNHVEEWSERYRIDVDFQNSGLNHRRLGPEVETTIYRIVQEALTNVVKHANAARVGLVIEDGPEHLVAIVEDDGVGFDPESVPGLGMGLLGMKERVALVGGTLQVESAPGCGTTLLIRIPRPCDPGGVEHEPASHLANR
jgi:signal transduction histidine kinase